MHISVLIAAAGCITTASAHIALWDKGMFGLNWPDQADNATVTNYNNNQPVEPLRELDALSTDQWFAHGMKGFPPKSGDFMILPAGGVYNGEVSCNRGGTTLRDPGVTDPLPQYACDGEGALHVANLFNETVDNQWFGGTSLAIAYTSNVATLQPNDMTVISVNQDSVWNRQIAYSIPAGLPACPTGGCLCTWNWIHQANNGEGYPFEIYNVPFRCQVTGSTNAANKVQRGAVPIDCTGNPTACVKGPKTPMYLYQADGNNLPHLSTPPLYRDSWGFAQGAQNDIFAPASTAAPTTYYVNPYATPTSVDPSQPTPSATALPSGWQALGCMSDSDTSRALPDGAFSSSNNLTISGCVATCASQGYLYAGVEYGQECWCSNKATLQSTNSTDCNSRCAGDLWAYCGGSYRINVFLNVYTPNTDSTITTPVPTTTAASPSVSLPAGWSSLGCMIDDPNYRALNRGSTISANNTIPSCIANCAKQGLPYAGVEYGQECWCGTSLNSTAVIAGSCNVPCAGDVSSMCGGSYRLNVFSNPASTVTATSVISSTTTKSASIASISTSVVTASPSTVKSSSSSSLMSSTSVTPSSITSKSVSAVATTPSSSVAKSSSTTSVTTSSVSPKSSSTTSTTAIPSTTLKSSAIVSTTSSSITSKLSSALPITSSSSTVKSSSSLALSSSTIRPTTTTTTSTSPAASAIASSTVPGWTHLGCSIDNTTRILPNNTITSTTSNSPQYCTSYCGNLGFTFAGVEAGSQCYCGNAATIVPGTGCSNPCTGDKTAVCGGSWRINVYRKIPGASSVGTISSIKATSSAGPSSTVTPSLAATSTSKSTVAISTTTVTPTTSVIKSTTTTAAFAVSSNAATVTVSKTVTVTVNTCASTATGTSKVKRSHRMNGHGRARGHVRAGLE